MNLHLLKTPRKPATALIAGGVLWICAVALGCTESPAMPRNSSPSPSNPSEKIASPVKSPPAGSKFDLEGAEARVRQAAESAKVAYPFKDPFLKVSKSPRRMELWAEGRLVKAYRVGLGAAPDEDKVREGDHRTPEGEFYVCTRNDLSKFHLFLGLSYPNAAHAERGLREGLISKSVYKGIVSANKRRERPPWDTHLGGQVGIHGNGSGSDWTWGCVAVEDFEIEELWVACPMRTPVFIGK